MRKAIHTAHRGVRAVNGHNPVSITHPHRAVARFGWSLHAELLDKAIDRATKVAEGIVAQFAAAPNEARLAALTAAQDGSSAIAGIPAVEVGVEFFVPPVSQDLFRHELEGQLQRLSPSYTAARYRGELGPVIVRPIPGGSFHQWRIAWRQTTSDQHRRRWSTDRDMLDSLLAQARNGWREVAM